MTTSRNISDSAYEQWTTSPVIDYEPIPQQLGRPLETPCPTPSVEALHRTPFRPRTAHRPPPRLCETPPPKSAVTFAETALRQVIEVIDRRRPVAQLRPLMTPVLVDRVIARAGDARSGSATMRRVRVRAVDPVDPVDPVEPGVDTGVGEICAAEVFASFTRSGRVHAIAGRIERYRGRWRIVALQIG